MLDYQPITRETIPLLRKYYADCRYGLCEYAAGTKYMWRDVLEPTWAESAGCLVIRNRIKGCLVFDYPVAGPNGDEESALAAIERDCIERNVPLILSVVPEEKTAVLVRRYPRMEISNMRTWKDYIYRPEDLQKFAGRRYAGQRNHIHKFRAACPDAEFRPLTAADLDGPIARFRTEYEREFFKESNPKAARELRCAWDMLELAGTEPFRALGCFDGDRLIALDMGEKCGNTLIVHIEKALYSYEGVYPAMVQAYAQACGTDVDWISREDDAADRGLRTSKLQYEPALLASKYRFEPQRDYLAHIPQLPELYTPRLTLSALTPADIPAYNALVLDTERNRWWGYDDVAGLGGPVEEESFFRVAQTDFQQHTAANFAVRLGDRLIGEAVLYNFDYQGRGELGCRIARAYAGSGYGTEAFAAAADWALYKVRLSRVVAKCFRENEPSRRMLASCMQPDGEDEKFLYFKKEV